MIRIYKTLVVCDFQPIPFGYFLANLDFHVVERRINGQ